MSHWLAKTWGYWGPLSEHRERTRLERNPNEGVGPACRCGQRNTARIGESSLQRMCQSCGQTYRYLLKDGLLIPHALETALALEGK